MSDHLDVPPFMEVSLARIAIALENLVGMLEVLIRDDAEGGNSLRVYDVSHDE